MAWWLGIGVGIGVMGGYAALRVWLRRVAWRRPDASAFVAVEMGGLTLRVLGLLGTVGLVLVFVPVHVEAFVGTVLALLILSIAVETAIVARRAG
ncbi:MAG: hypothetical protein ABEL97_08010 [Salinibacter sp.]